MLSVFCLVPSAVCLLLVSSGCWESKKPLKYLGEGKVGHYREIATDIDYSDVSEPVSHDAVATEKPRRLRHPRKDEIWDMPLAEALHTALSNAEVIRDAGQFLSPQNTLLANPDLQPSIYDPAIQESGVLFGQRGVEAALSEFDAQFTANMLWGRDERVLNNFNVGGFLQNNNRVLREETGQFQSRLEKTFATGGRFAVSHNWNYTLNNQQVGGGGNLFGSFYTGLLQAEYRQPLLAGAGTEFTRIAGPIGRQVQGVSGVSQGVVIARINNDITLAEFEAEVRNLLKDVEDTYWSLYLAYRTYDAEVVARNSAQKTWAQAKARVEQGLESAAAEAQARDNYFEAKARAENALADLYATEGRLRRLLGLPVNDGRIIRPADEPLTAEFVPDWYASLAQALTERVELRRQKWNIKSLQLQLKAARSLTRPQLDFVSNYRLNGFGDELIASEDDDSVTGQGFNNAYETLTQGDQTGWNLGFELSMPLGFRAAHAQVQNLELRLAKARATLSTQEHEISHELSQAFQNIDRAYQTAHTNFNRRQAAQERVEAYEAEYRAGRPNVTLDLVLRAQISRAQADIAYYQSLVQYNQAIVDLNLRRGTLLEENNVYLAEDEWDPGAYEEAYERAHARSHALEVDHLKSEPASFVTGGYLLDPEELGMPERLEAEPAEGPVPPGPEKEDSESQDKTPSSDGKEQTPGGGKTAAVEKDGGNNATLPEWAPQPGGNGKRSDTSQPDADPFGSAGESASAAGPRPPQSKASGDGADPFAGGTSRKAGNTESSTQFADPQTNSSRAGGTNAVVRAEPSQLRWRQIAEPR